MSHIYINLGPGAVFAVCVAAFLIAVASFRGEDQ